MKTEVDYWSTKDADEHLSHEDIGEAVYEWWDQGGEEDEVTVYGYKRREPPSEEKLGEVTLEMVLEYLDCRCELRDPYNDKEPTSGMKEAARTFARELLKEYSVWACELVETKRVKVSDYLSPEEMKRDE